MYCNLGGTDLSTGSCRAMCMFGGTCVDGKCVCAPGYTGEFCTERKYKLSFIHFQFIKTPIILLYLLIPYILNYRINIVRHCICIDVYCAKYNQIILHGFAVLQLFVWMLAKMEGVVLAQTDVHVFMDLLEITAKQVNQKQYLFLLQTS